jgi:hypothetical protein
MLVFRGKEDFSWKKIKFKSIPVKIRGRAFYEDEEFFSRGRKKHLEDQNFSSNKSEENDISRIDFLAKIGSRKKILEAQKTISRVKKLENFLRGISSRFFLDIVHLEVFVTRTYICILEDAVLIKKNFLFKNNLFELKVAKSIIRINWKFIKLLKFKYRI